MGFCMKVRPSVLLVVLLSGCAGHCSPGDGVRVGQVVAVNHHGLFHATWEAEFLKGGLVAGSGGTGAGAFWVTIENDSLLQLVKTAADSGWEMKYTWHSESTCSVYRSESGCDFLTSIARVH